jgi:hypothetical protein
MYEAPRDWNSFWDLATPTEAAAMLRDSYGPHAAAAAEECASAAKNDNRESDHRFWLAVSAELNAAKRIRSSPPGPVRH